MVVFPLRIGAGEPKLGLTPPTPRLDLVLLLVVGVRI